VSDDRRARARDREQDPTLHLLTDAQLAELLGKLLRAHGAELETPRGQRCGVRRAVSCELAQARTVTVDETISRRAE
jgi:hypothetical protein